MLQRDINTIPSFDQLCDRDLLVHVQRAAQGERHATAHLLALLMELDTRKLYLAEGCSSLFTYCTQQLHLSEHAAYLRIEAARAARRFPLVLDRLADGRINLTAIGLLAPHLTANNHERLLNAATHKRRSDIDHLVAQLRPQPDVRTTVRKIPDRAAVPADRPTVETLGKLLPISAAAETCQAVSTVIARRPAEVKPLAPERYKVRFTMSRESYELLRRAQDLLRHTVPNGDPATIFERALTALVRELERTKIASIENPRPRSARPPALSRHISPDVRRRVWERDGGRCAFRGTADFLRLLWKLGLDPVSTGITRNVAESAPRARSINRGRPQRLSARAESLSREARVGRPIDS